MKKILLIIILFFCFLNYIKAETFYGEYRLVDDIGEYKDDLLKIEKGKLYNTYKNKYIDMGYMLENNEYIKDENDYVEKYTNINKNDIGDEYIKLKSINKNSYLLQFRVFKSYMKIYEVEIYYKNKKLSYGFINNPSSKLSNIVDNDYITYIDCAEIQNFYVNLYNHYNSSDITIIIYTDDDVDYNFLLSFGDYTTNITLHNKNKNKHIISFNNEEVKINYEYMGFKKLYRYYKEEKEVLNNYVEYSNNILEDDYIEFDTYYVRDKLILNDIMIINNSEQKAEDFIEYSSDKVNVECTIDYNVNGKYICEYILNDISVKRNIIVNIPNVEEMKLNEIRNNVNNISKVIENNIDDKSVVLVNNDKNKIKEIRKINTIIHKNNLIKYIKYIIIVNLIIIEIILFIKKKKK